jgi:hypothetical protein
MSMNNNNYTKVAAILLKWHLSYGRSREFLAAAKSRAATVKQHAAASSVWLSTWQVP